MLKFSGKCFGNILPELRNVLPILVLQIMLLNLLSIENLDIKNFRLINRGLLPCPASPHMHDFSASILACWNHHFLWAWSTPRFNLCLLGIWKISWKRKIKSGFPSLDATRNCGWASQDSEARAKEWRSKEGVHGHRAHSSSNHGFLVQDCCKWIRPLCVKYHCLRKA